MISRRLYLNMIFRVLVLIALSVGLGWSLQADNVFFIAPIIIIGLIISTVSLVRHLNSTNRKMSFFFEAVKNNDSALSFGRHPGNKTEDLLNRKLNEVNKQIQNLKMENRQKEQYFRTMLENVATGIIAFNSKGAVLHANSSVKKMLSLEVLTHLKQIEKLDDRLYRTIQNIKPMEHRLISISNDNVETEFSLYATPFNSGGNQLIILSVQDIKNELDARELSSWIKLIRVLIHEIMNTVTPITSLSESLYKKVVKDKKLSQKADENDFEDDIVCQGLEVIHDQSKGLMNFVESYRELTKLPKPEKKNFKILDLLKRVKILFETEYNSNLNIKIKSDPQELELLADENQISQVLINIVKNAVQANEENANAEIKISASMLEGKSLIEIIDNGPGISPEIMDKIFVPFFTTNENGSGIGLSISKQIISLHGGLLKVKSKPGVETVFNILI